MVPSERSRFHQTADRQRNRRMIWLAALSAMIWVYLLFFHGQFWQAGPILPLSPRVSATSVTVVIPARDEAESIARCLRSLALQDHRALHVIMVDDASSDGTGDIARAIAAETFPNRLPGWLQVIAGKPRPAGWSGKLWAVHQGVAAARDDILLLTDADIEHAPGHIASLLAQAESKDLDMTSEMVALNVESWPERALVPAFVFFFQMLYPFARVNDPLSATAAAAGGTVMIRRRALKRIGGIESLHGALIDDVTLAGRVKTGGPIWLGHSALARSIRPYPHPADIWRMIARTAFVQLRFSWTMLVLTVLGMLIVWIAPPALAMFGHGVARWLGLAAWLGAMASYLPTLKRFGLSPLWALALPVIAGFYTAATIGSAIDHATGRGVRWKSRAYTEHTA
ncbi:HpnB protein [Granulibacter bethesdensis]|nr:HpnB protein [Granulibacter bethesdensis]